MSQPQWDEKETVSKGWKGQTNLVDPSQRNSDLKASVPARILKLTRQRNAEE